jgi:hypothetical protein
MCSGVAAGVTAGDACIAAAAGVTVGAAYVAGDFISWRSAKRPDANVRFVTKSRHVRLSPESAHSLF